MIHSIILVGPRASGKTTVGKMLAAQLHRPFIDTDDVVQKQTNKTIARIVDEQGWERFRYIESQILQEVTLSNAVIATGGGMVVSPENRLFMRHNGTVFYLATSAETVVARLKSNPAVSQRPSLTGLSITEEITGIIAERAPLYQESAHYVINADKDKSEVLQQIYAICEQL